MPKLLHAPCHDDEHAVTDIKRPGVSFDDTVETVTDTAVEDMYSLGLLREGGF